MKCLSIESVEYCYFIPIVFQLADYWGDRKIAYLCKIMSRQVKQHLNHATHIHLLLSLPFRDLKAKGSRKGKRLKVFLQDYRYANDDDLRPLVKEGSHGKKKQQYWQLLFDTRIACEYFKNRNLNSLMEASNEEYSYLPYSTFFSLLPLQKDSLLERFPIEKVLKQKNLREKPFFSLRYDLKRHRGTKKRKRYNQELAFSLNISLKGFFEENFHLLHQTKQLFPLCPRIFTVMPEPIVLDCFQKDNHVNYFTQTNPIGLSDQTLNFQSCLDKGKTLKEKKKREFFIGELKEKIVISYLQNLDNSFFEVLEDINSEGFERQEFESNIFNDSSFSSYRYFPLSYLLSVHRILYEKQGFIGNRGSQIENSFDYLELIRQKRINKIVNFLSMSYRKDIFLMFFQILRDRKIWKAKQWYPFVSTLSVNSRFFFHADAPFDSFYFYAGAPLSSGFRITRQKDFQRIERQLYQSFFKLFQSEKEMSQLITILISKLL